MRQRFVAGNWKMHGNSQGNRLLMEGLVAGAGAIRDIQCAVCVPFPYLHQARSLLAGTGVHWGAQNVSQWQEGAYTGEVSAAMLADFDCRFVGIVEIETIPDFAPLEWTVDDFHLQFQK